VSDAPPAPPGFWALLGCVVEAADDDGVTLRIDVPDAFLSPFGTVHGGLVATLFDTALAVAVHRRLGAGGRVATHHLNVSFIALTRVRRLRCRARVIKLGRTVANLEGEVTDDEGTLVAKALATFGVRRAAD
jgi:acyl-CoA thioesterase